MISNGRGEDELLRAVRENGYRRMWWDGLEKVKAGITTLRELARSVQIDESINNGPQKEVARDASLQEPFGP